MTNLKKIRLAFVLVLAAILLVSCGQKENKAYGVFLGSEDGLDQFKDYDLVVIDAQYYTKNEIESFQSSGHEVYSYINIGSLEEFRDYYDEYKDLSLGAYENWDGEYWMDVSNDRWQDFLTKDLKKLLLEKGIDGFFVDNCDVYYQYPSQDILNGISAIMSDLIQTGKPVIINGGDAYMDAYCEAGGIWSDVITGINQESVFSRILWNTGTFGTALDEDRSNFQEYLEKYAAKGADIYILEYTKDEALKKQIERYCNDHGFTCYIANSIELDANN